MVRERRQYPAFYPVTSSNPSLLNLTAWHKWRGKVKILGPGALKDSTQRKRQSCEVTKYKYFVPVREWIFKVSAVYLSISFSDNVLLLLLSFVLKCLSFLLFKWEEQACFLHSKVFKTNSVKTTICSCCCLKWIYLNYDVMQLNTKFIHIWEEDFS